MNGKDELLRMISETAIFSNVPKEVLHRICENAQYNILPPHTMIFRQGDVGEGFYIILSGHVRIFRKCKDGTETELAILGPGDIFGELALLAEEPRAGCVETIEETHVILIPKEQFDNILKDYPHVISIFLKKLYRWIIQSDLTIEFNKKLIEYEKLSVLGRLTANVAHEIRNPISIIAGFTERLKRSGSHGTREKEYLDIISSETKKLEEILREVIIFSDEPLSRRVELDINNVIIECVAVYRDECEKHSIQVNTHFNHVTHIFIDEKRIKHAINSLISNALEAMPGGGILTMRTNEESIGGKKYVALEVSDTGVGIPENILPMIFEPFFSTKVTKKETGLGLPITKKIIESHSGLIKVNSVVGRGSTFILFFPYRKHTTNHSLE